MDGICNGEVSGYYLGGGDVTSCVVIRDQILLAIKSNILSYSLKAGALLHIQDAGSSQISGIQLSPINSQQLITTCKSGTISTWDVTDWTEMKRENLDSCISHLLVSRSKDNIFVVTRANVNEKEVTTIKKLSPTNLSHISDILIIRKPCDNFAISSCGTFILFTRDTHVRVINTITCATFTCYTHTAELSTATIHRTQNLAAVSDVQGQICILSDWNVKGCCNVISLQHWHGNGVGGMCFAPRSDVLFSGGVESVLVKWLEGEPQFLPRIGAGIEHVFVPDTGDVVVLVTEDSLIHIVSLNTWTVKHRITNVIRSKDGYKAGIVAVENSKHVMFPATSGTLQIFDVDSRLHKCSVDITHQNKTTGHSRYKKLSYIDITHFQITGDGKWLVTIERRDDGFITPECRLKFWDSPDSENFDLDTCIEPPHNKVVTSLNVGYTRSTHIAVTTSTDCSVKIWQTFLDNDKENSAKAQNNNNWILGKVLSHQTGPAFCSSISSDGTVLAVAYKGVTVLYSSIDWEIKAEIPQSINRIDQMYISGYYLLTSAKDLISVWNLTSLSLWWEVSCQVSYILHLPDKTFVAFVSRKSVTDAYIFTTASSDPVYIHKFVCPGVVQSACVVEDQVVMLNMEQELYVLSAVPPPPIALSHIEEEELPSIFSELLRIQIPATSKTDTAIKQHVKLSTAAAILDVSNSVLPRISSICSNVLEDFLPKK